MESVNKLRNQNELLQDFQEKKMQKGKEEKLKSNTNNLHGKMLMFLKFEDNKLISSEI